MKQRPPTLVPFLCGFLIVVLLALPSESRANPEKRDYTPPPPASWEYLSDRVMGGVSEGSARVEGDHVRLTGEVSTRNRGGFIQTRTDLARPFPDDAKGLIIRVRGNGERYFLHLRTTGTILPWQYYQAGFETTRDWRTLRVPFSEFQPSGRMLRGTPRAETVRSVGFVAFGRDHLADLAAEWIGIY
ncbi:NADH ubiquinone oxidoreductase [Roseovarius sp. TE539]|uniref:CIA30 family protein n=1 Tax=Roseovarius sp. TE539 TaxID=2249812 RepID=UPI000DDF08B1|nr:CIA30 family protein [Roseovarius sp. TE539]RBI75675.1 NADH ubiquinone oxidoreductase [Roseovarius sp. TE539]